MPLVQEQVEPRLIPDNKGGWFWMRWMDGGWCPVFVFPAPPDRPGITSYIRRGSSNIPVTDKKIQWGHQTFPPGSPELIEGEGEQK